MTDECTCGQCKHWVPLDSITMREPGRCLVLIPIWAMETPGKGGCVRHRSEDASFCYCYKEDASLATQGEQP
jgi:hypothetical protein